MLSLLQLLCKLWLLEKLKREIVYGLTLQTHPNETKASEFIFRHCIQFESTCRVLSCIVCFIFFVLKMYIFCVASCKHNKPTQ